jgi:hypothetical protein
MEKINLQPPLTLTIDEGDGVLHVWILFSSINKNFKWFRKTSCIVLGNFSGIQ